jgi:P-type Mg2+ transporter
VGRTFLVTKGEAENVFAICQSVSIDGSPQPFNDERRAQAAATYQKLSADGYRTLGVAMVSVARQDAYTTADERNLTLVGFAAFLDPPKEGVAAVLEALKQNGISVVVMTGDNQYVTQKVARDVGLPADLIITGNQCGCHRRCRIGRSGRKRRDFRTGVTRTEEPRHPGAEGARARCGFP